ncbi:MAG: Arabinoxylan arabinofuranohydrolase, partial [Candidatus Ordinivivax streblomastigis]
PQTIYDPVAKKYMVYFSMHVPNGKDIIYYAYANSSFTALETIPQQLYFPADGNSCIDGDIIPKDGKYYLFYKTEGNGNGIRCAVAESVTGTYVLQSADYVNQTKDSAEGSCVYQLINSDTYVLMYDVYNQGKYEFCTSTDLKNFTLTNKGKMNFSPRHGTVISITAEELNRLTTQWGSGLDLSITGTLSPLVKTQNIVIAAENIFLPVRQGTDLTAFDPQLTSILGTSCIFPQGVQDFSQGAVTYQLKIGGIQQNYTVTAALNNNPVLDGYYADPYILYSHKNKRYYLYPTTDGLVNWSSSSFSAFSSENMVEWQNEGVILDLKKAMPAWGRANAWAPSIIEVNYGEYYKYFYYFSASKKIGVAVADEPIGPFKPITEALVGEKPAGVTSGQEIDPDVFRDPVTGKAYLYWGNGYLAVAELNGNMTSFRSATQVITPDDTFREGVHVFYRNGKYYFLWSENDTRETSYQVRYGVADSPLGPIQVPANNLILSKNYDLKLFGTGHCSVIQAEENQWYIVYHRIARPKGMALGAGYYREVCIDKLDFDAQGAIQAVVPSLEGIGPVQYSGPDLPVTNIPNVIPLISYQSSVTNKKYYSLSGNFLGSNKDSLQKGTYIQQIIFANGQRDAEVVLK